MFTPFENHTTELAAAMYAPCAAVGCSERAKPENALEAKLDIFGSPLVTVRFCDNHYHLLGSSTDEHEIVPDIAVEEKPLRTGGIAIVHEGGKHEFVSLPQGTSVYPVDKEQ